MQGTPWLDGSVHWAPVPSQSVKRVAGVCLSVCENV